MNQNLLRNTILLLSASAAGALAPFAANAADTEASPDSRPPAVVMTVTATAKKNAQPPNLKRDDVQLYEGKERVQIADFKRGDTLFLGVLIDDSLRSDIANQWNDLRVFLVNQPKTTYVAVAYARNGVAMVAQDFTTDHVRAAKALRIPLGTITVANSPYLAVQDWMKRWPVNGERSSIVVFSSGIDYFRGGPASIDPDLDTTIARAQKQNINIWSIYVPDVGSRRRGSFRAFDWQSNLDRMSQGTGGEAYYLSLAMPVDLRPYFDTIREHLDNQYLLAFHGNGGAKGKYQSVKVSSELANVRFLTPSQVFLPAGQ